MSLFGKGTGFSDAKQNDDTAKRLFGEDAAARAEQVTSAEQVEKFLDMFRGAAIENVTVQRSFLDESATTQVVDFIVETTAGAVGVRVTGLALSAGMILTEK